MAFSDPTPWYKHLGCLTFMVFTGFFLILPLIFGWPDFGLMVLLFFVMPEGDYYKYNEIASYAKPLFFMSFPIIGVLLFWWRFKKD